MAVELAVRHSPIHGLGVYALSEIRRGTPILPIDDSRVVDREHPLQDDESAKLCDYLPDGTTTLMRSPECYIDHACTPNTYVYSVNRMRFVLSRRDIGRGEELTIDYALNAVDGDEWQCHCGAPNCRGLHTCDFFALSLEEQLENLPYLDPWFALEQAARIQALIRHGLERRKSYS